MINVLHAICVVVCVVVRVGRVGVCVYATVVVVDCVGVRDGVVFV